ncbi:MULTISPECIES: hydantoinase/oxoprolinase family protein [unclassified Sphingomonas]|uniref:hydantoinase/oxoprolinase family protein n=1 Tax=unclassified Sphingomonas TaxID=196159 RepID=UPI0006F42AC6|nr:MULTISPECIES: hydantoinase/oxoprolinase family protein [unclassified Sphingomonas]KQX25970.1 5-oxoprolinase [Sphingomonas sp. Root1294]KQY69035.1 5-oxoprolinase [Sphingomonas sp. Root50]KRB89290.1 5-oxoprolinase [Sphingomonas sp. Root720]
MRRLRIATDVGGTFTDLVAQEMDEAGQLVAIHSAKADTTPPDFEKGILNVLDRADLSAGDAAFFVHGTTVVINALTERKGAPTGLITTAGFRDVLEIGRGNCPDYFNIRFEKPTPFVRRKHRRVLEERIDYQGCVVRPLDLGGLPEILADFDRDAIGAVAVCFINGYANSDHERRVIEEIGRLRPDLSVVASHQITREWREYERTSTTVLSAYVQPAAKRYLAALDQGLKAQGMTAGLHIMQSNGGIDSVAATVERPITIVESGPASGIFAAAALGRLIGRPNVIALDIGGTTAKCALVEDGEVPITTEYYIERHRRFAGYPIMTPTVDIVEIGNGGGSIAWIDDYRVLHVGPKSAGATPGPVAYGRGGTSPTTTDANLITGRIDSESFCGGAVDPDMAAVRAAFTALGEPLGCSAIEAARGVLRVANHNMVNALKLISVDRGHDPRDFAMVAFGGGGAMHAALLARELRIPLVVIPAAAAVFSAWGMLMADLRRDYVVTRPALLTPDSVGEMLARFDDLRGQAEREFEELATDMERLDLELFVDARYDGQDNTVRVPLPRSLRDERRIDEFEEHFREIFARKYGYRLDTGVEVVNLHLAAFGRVSHLAWSHEAMGEASADCARIGSRNVDFDALGLHPATIYDRRRLCPGMRFVGPAIVQQDGTTTVIPPGDAVAIDAHFNICITIAGE